MWVWDFVCHVNEATRKTRLRITGLYHSGCLYFAGRVKWEVTFLLAHGLMHKCSSLLSQTRNPTINPRKCSGTHFRLHYLNNRGYWKSSPCLDCDLNTWPLDQLASVLVTALPQSHNHKGNGTNILVCANYSSVKCLLFWHETGYAVLWSI